MSCQYRYLNNKHDHPEGVTPAGRTRWGSTEHWFQSVVPSRNWLWIPAVPSVIRFRQEVSLPVTLNHVLQADFTTDIP